MSNDDFDSVLVLLILAIMTLHLKLGKYLEISNIIKIMHTLKFVFLGIVNKLFDLLTQLLNNLENCSMTTDDWSTACGIGTRPEGYQGWKGNECDILLKPESLQKLRDLLEKSFAWYIEDSHIPEVFEALLTFSYVKKSCFGIQLDPDYTSSIKNFADAYHYLVRKKLLNVTTKVHIGMLKS